MDLDMIQDLLGGSNLPPPPSVQDLLGEVVPVPASPSPPASPSSFLRLSTEHSYSKGAMDEGAAAGEAEPMDQGTAQTSGSQTLAQLSSTSDCYEAFLLNLLRVYTQNRIESLSNSETQISTAGQSSGSADTNGSSGMTMIDSISPEAILALSHEQVQSLVTSNSSNYDVIHQILAYRQRTLGGGGSEGNGEKAVGETESTLQQLQALQLSPEQLKQIQLQMEELIRTKQIVLPAELSVEQQQQLLQSLILKHIHSQHQQLLATPSTTTTTTPPATQPTVTPPTTQQPLPASPPPPPPNTLSGVSTNPPNTQSSKTTVGSTLAAMLRGESEKVTGVDGEEGGGGGGGGGEIGRKEVTKMEVPSPSSAQGGGKTKTVALQLSSNPVNEDGSQVATSAATTPTTPTAGVTTRSGGRKKKDTKDPDEPKKPSSPYGVFFSDVYPSVLQANPRMSFSEASKLISAMWNAMGIDTKKQYHERSEKQKEVYQTYQTSRKTETTPTEELAATSPEVTMETKTLAEVTPATQQTASSVDLTTGADQVVGGGSAVSQIQSPPPPPPPPPPAPTAPRVAVKDLRHCVNDGCFKDAVYTESRGPRYCSNECVIQHCKSVFQEWVAQRKVAT